MALYKRLLLESLLLCVLLALLALALPISLTASDPTPAETRRGELVNTQIVARGFLSKTKNSLLNVGYLGGCIGKKVNAIEAISVIGNNYVGAGSYSNRRPPGIQATHSALGGSTPPPAQRPLKIGGPPSPSSPATKPPMHASTKDKGKAPMVYPNHSNHGEAGPSGTKSH
ncbi:unnamed protein product [Sympodiomycopsis kandeliae]